VYNRRHWHDEEEAAFEAANRQTAGLVGIAVILLLLIVGLFLVHHLHTTSMVEDCLLAGRRDCDLLLQAGR
jgi:hypothetical protein